MIQYAPHFTHAVTLTMKQSRIVATNTGQMVQRLTEIEAKDNFRYFVKRLNASMFGNASKRHAKTVYVIPVLEGMASSKQLHYHCMMGSFRNGATNELITAAIRDAWLKTNFGNVEIDVQSMYDNGWIDYITKEVGMGDADNVDYGNVHVPKL